VNVWLTWPGNLSRCHATLLRAITEMKASRQEVHGELSTEAVDKLVGKPGESGTPPGKHPGLLRNVALS